MKKIKVVENKQDFCEKIARGEVEDPREWHMRHPRNQSILKPVKEADRVCAIESRDYSDEELAAFKREFLDARKKDFKPRNVKKLTATDESKEGIRKK
jgi:hypothetical protein